MTRPNDGLRMPPPEAPGDDATRWRWPQGWLAQGLTAAAVASGLGRRSRRAAVVGPLLLVAWVGLSRVARAAAGGMGGDTLDAANGTPGPTTEGELCR